MRLTESLAESKDTMIRAENPSMVTGKKETAKSATQQSLSAIGHKYIMGQIEHGSGDLGMSVK